MPILAVETAGSPGPRPTFIRLRGAANAARETLLRHLAPSGRSRLTRIQLAALAAVFLLALGVRVLHWQDSHVDIVLGKTSLSGVFNRYQKEARRILDDGGILFPREPPASGDARMLVHPPGYAILLAAIHRPGVDEYKGLWVMQTALDAASALLVFVIASELMNWSVGLIAALLVAFSPHLAYYSLILSPDSLAVLPLLGAVYFFIRAYGSSRLIFMIAAGGLVGLSCWLRANALLLAPFLSLVALVLFERGKRLRYAAALSGAAIIVISPITIRNMVVYHRFIPVSIAAGENLAVGIGDYDRDGKFGMPRSDREARAKDAEWNGRPDYEASLWTPDGIERDRVRMARGLSVIRSNPGWFAGVMLRRAGFMLSYNDSRPHPWPVNTAVVPPVSAEPPFGHSITTAGARGPSSTDSPTILILNGSVITQPLTVTGDKQPEWSSSAEELIANGTPLSQKATVSLAADKLTFQLAGDDSQYGDQFESALFPVHRYTDYVLEVPLGLAGGNMALKVTSADRRLAAAVATIPGAETREEMIAPDTVVAKDAVEQAIPTIQIAFASGKNTELRLVLSNNGSASPPPAVEVGPARIFEIGATPHSWTRYPRSLIRGLQRNLYTTSRMLPAVVIGIAFLALARRRDALLMILAVPVYYLCAQSALSTEYRYILSIHYFLFMMAAAALNYFGSMIVDVSRLAARRFAGGIIKAHL